MYPLPDQRVPEFAILGHPNEGKSSVLSTLTEDDSVRISPTPGETKSCRTFPVIIDGKEIIRFTDTPGFQNPTRILHELSQSPHPAEDKLHRLLEAMGDIEEMRDDCELLSPLVRGAGVIYVADGSRPIRNVDLAEMEILRITGKPRMAILNSKSGDQQYLQSWKTEFRKNFNSSRVFNAHSATYVERIKLLRALQSIEQDWHEPLEYVVSSFKRDWQARNGKTAELICEMVKECLTLVRKEAISPERDADLAREELFRRYADDIRSIEANCHLRIRKLFKHNIFDCSLPQHSLVNEDLFSQQTWKFLGLRKKQLVLAGGASGAVLAAGLDLAAGGASLGLFTSLGGILGAVGAFYGGQSIAEKTQTLGLEGKKLHLQVGPAKNVQFGFILLDRALIYYSYIINWAHGRRDYSANEMVPQVTSYTRNLDHSSQRQLSRYFKNRIKATAQQGEEDQQCREIIEMCLHDIPNGRRR